MKLIGMIIGSDRYLIDLEENDMGFIFDDRQGLKYPSQSIYSLIKFVQWDEVDNDPLIIERVVKATQVNRKPEEELYRKGLEKEAKEYAERT